MVSALQGITSVLQATLEQAKANCMEYMYSLEKIEETHLILISELGLDVENYDLTRFIQNDIFKIKDILYSVYLTGIYSKETQNFILGYGELWSVKY